MINKTVSNQCFERLVNYKLSLIVSISYFCETQTTQTLYRIYRYARPEKFLYWISWSIQNSQILRTPLSSSFRESQVYRYEVDNLTNLYCLWLKKTVT